MKKIVLFCLITFHIYNVKCELIQIDFKRIVPNNEQNLLMTSHFSSFILAELDITFYDSLFRTKTNWPDVLVSIDTLQFQFNLMNRELRSNKYKLRVENSGIISELPSYDPRTYYGKLSKNTGDIRLTTNSSFFMAMIIYANDEIYIEPASNYFENISSKIVVIYRKSTVIQSSNEYVCYQNLSNNQKLLNEFDKHPIVRQNLTEPICWVTEIALANDWLMYNKYGSIQSVENHNMAVLNNVEANFDDEFDKNLEFSLVEIYIVSNQGMDPWTTSTDPQTLLTSFSSWAPNGFSNDHDLASLWTDRDLDGNTVGYAWISTVCGINRYNILQDYTTYAPFLRVLQAHELGHNYSATHDPENSGFIMTPTINETNIWSTASLSLINAKLNSVFCLQPCCDNLSAPNLSGDYTIGPTGDFLSLGEATTELLHHGLDGHTTFKILDSIIEQTMVQIYPWGSCDDSLYILTIKPELNTAPVVSGNFDVNSTLININGADHLIIDGSHNGSMSKDLTFRNTGFGSTIRFVNDATFNTIKNSVIEGSGGGAGNIRFFNSSGGQFGNSNNNFYNCKVRDRTDVSGQPPFGIYSNGSSSAPNSNNAFRKCEIFNWTSEGISVSSNGAGNGWVIDSCSFYRTTSTSNQLTGIHFDGGSGHLITNNYIGGTALQAGGDYLATTNAIRGIYLNVGSSLTSSIQNNTIKNIRSTYTGANLSFGIFIPSGLVDVGTVTGNRIGGSTFETRMESNTSYGVWLSGTSNVNLFNTIIENYYSSSEPPLGNALYGIYVVGNQVQCNIQNSVIRDITNFGLPGSSKNTETIGININGITSPAISDNIIEDIGCMSNNTSSTYRNRIWGIRLMNTDTGTLINLNLIKNLYGNTTSTSSLVDQIYGIGSEGSTSALISNNMISLNGGSNSNREITGLAYNCLQPSQCNFYYNSVAIHGVSTGDKPTYAFYRLNNGFLELRNNIFSNQRLNGTGQHAAIANLGPIAGWNSSGSDYNILYSSDDNKLGNWLGIPKSFSQWIAPQTDPLPGSGGDSNSYNGIPGFMSFDNLHVTIGSCFADAGGILLPGISIDYDGEVRDSIHPDIGADEYSPMLSGSPIVTQNENDGAGSLRDIIECSLDGASISFDNSLMGDTIKLDAEIEINKNLIVTGLGQVNTVISGTLNDRIFHIHPNFELTLQQLSLSDGLRNLHGGAIFVEGMAHLNNVRLQNNFEGMLRKSLSLSPAAILEINGVVELKE